MTTSREFINYLIPMRNPAIPGNTAKIAKLKRGLGQQPLLSMEAISVIHQGVTENTEPWLLEAYQIVAPLFAFHPAEGGQDNMGDHFRELWGEDTEEAPANIERRFVRLLAAEWHELADALRQAISLLKANDVPVNWYRLLDDLLKWRQPEARIKVQDKWSRAFWCIRSDQPQDQSNVSQDDSDNESTIED